MNMPYVVKQWVEVNGIMRPEFEYQDPNELADEQDPVDKINSLLDKPFDELTAEEWQLLKETDTEF